MYLANKFQNIKGSADTLLELAGIEMDELAPVAEAMERGGRLAAKEKVTTLSSIVASRSPARPTSASRRSRSTARPGARTSCSSFWGEDRHRQLELFGEHVLPRVR